VGPVSLPLRITALIVGVFVVAAIAAFVVIHYFLGNPPTENFTGMVHNGQVNIVMQEDPQNTVTSKPDWVSYFMKSPTTGKWVHTTVFQVPANTRVNMTIYGFDGCTPLRNPVWGRVTGTIGGVEYVNGAAVKVLNSWSGCNVGHTFSIPGIGLNVPMKSPTLTQSLCSTSPCLPVQHKGYSFETMKFSFMTPKTTGVYFWQCRIPCGGGFVTGFGGPMQTIGYMTGNMEVVS
jgi:hypothetical protein